MEVLPKSSIFMGSFPYKPSIVEVPPVMETPSSMGTEPKIIQQYSTAPHGPLMLKQDTFDSPRPPASSENVSHTVLANPEDII